MPSDKFENTETGGAIGPKPETARDLEQTGTEPIDTTPATEPASDGEGSRAEPSNNRSDAILTKNETGATTPADTETVQPQPSQSDQKRASTHSERQRSSFAAKALTFIVVLIGGAALGVWGAPQVAPLLPSGMAPVAAWLSPGESGANGRIEALEASLGNVSAQIADVPSAADIEATTQRLVSETEAKVAAEISAMRDLMSGSDLSEAGARIGQLQSSMDGVLADLASVRAQVESGSMVTVDGAVIDLEAFRADLDAMRADVGELRAEIGQLSEAVSGLGARLDTAETNAQMKIEEAEAASASAAEAAAAARDQAAIDTELAKVGVALANGQPYAEELASLEATTGVAVPAGLAVAAASGAATLTSLKEQFGEAAHEAIRASIVAGAGEGIIAKSSAFLQAQVVGRSLEPQEGATPDAILSRVEAALRSNDLNKAIEEAGQLPSEAMVALNGWLAATKLRADAEAGLAELSSAVSNLN